MTLILLAFFPPSCVFLLSPTFPPYNFSDHALRIASPQHFSLGPSIFSQFTPEDKGRPGQPAPSWTLDSSTLLFSVSFLTHLLSRGSTHL